jgi:hypothetical protein
MSFKTERKVFKRDNSYGKSGIVVEVICFNGDAVLPEYYEGCTEAIVEKDTNITPDITILQCGSLVLTCEHYIELQAKIQSLQRELNELQTLARNVETAVFSRVVNETSDAYGKSFVAADCIVEIPDEESFRAIIYPAIKLK